MGPFVDSTDGDTEKTGLTISNTDVFIWKAGATRTYHAAAGLTHISNGRYYGVLDANDTNTKGPIIISVHESGALVEKLLGNVLDPNEYDRKYSTGEIDVYSVGGSKPVATNLVTMYATNWATVWNTTTTTMRVDVNTVDEDPPIKATGGSSELALDADGHVTIADGTITEDTFDGTTAVAQTGDSYARLGTPVGFTFGADTSSILNAIGSPSTSLAADMAANRVAADANFALVLADTALWDTSAEAKTMLFGADANGVTTESGVRLTWQYATTVASATSATVFVLSAGPDSDTWFGRREWLCCVKNADGADPNLPAVETIQSYVASSKTVTLAAALPFTPEAGDTVELIPIAWSRPAGGRAGAAK